MVNCKLNSTFSGFDVDELLIPAVDCAARIALLTDFCEAVLSFAAFGSPQSFNIGDRVYKLAKHY